MSEGFLIAGFICCSLVITGFLLYPLRHTPKLVVCTVPLLLTLIGLGYYRWGGFALWHSYLVKQEEQLHAKALLQGFKSTKQIIQVIQAKLEREPGSAKGWYLLGRLYLQEQQASKASLAFSKAYHLEPANKQYALQYAYDAWLGNKQKISPEIRTLLNQLILNNPKEVDALALLAKDAFVHKDYEKAVGYWQKLLPLFPRGSKEAKAITKALIEAKELRKKGILR